MGSDILKSCDVTDIDDTQEWEIRDVISREVINGETFYRVEWGDNSGTC